VKTLTLGGKEKMCLNSQIICDGRHCPYAFDFYSKLVDQDVTAKLAVKASWGSADLALSGRRATNLSLLFNF
jgi:hypothetical protein